MALKKDDKKDTKLDPKRHALMKVAVMGKTKEGILKGLETAQKVMKGDMPGMPAELDKLLDKKLGKKK
jgi:hypothetical protein